VVLLLAVESVLQELPVALMAAALMAVAECSPFAEEAGGGWHLQCLLPQEVV